MKIATWNVNGIRARQEGVLAWLAKDAPDIVCLQETKASPENVPAPLLELPDYWGYWHGFKGYSGVALLVPISIMRTGSSSRLSKASPSPPSMYRTAGRVSRPRSSF